jgi:hypothetical protein
MPSFNYSPPGTFDTSIDILLSGGRTVVCGFFRRIYRGVVFICSPIKSDLLTPKFEFKRTQT